MINPKRFREDAESVRKALLSRGVDAALIQSYIDSDLQWTSAQQTLEQLQQERNQSIPKGKPSEEDQVKLAALSKAVKDQELIVNELANTQRELALQIPNTPQPSTPLGKSEADNVVLRHWGEPKKMDFQPLSHDELGTKLGIYHAAQASTISGARFAVLSGFAAALERALFSFMLDTHIQNGYLEMQLPALVNSQSLIGTGQLPKFKDDLFAIHDSDLWLSSTGEVQLTNFFRDSILKKEELPVRVTTCTPCFRKEAGSYGKDTKGLIRLHQFNKVELLKLVTEEESNQELERLVQDAESILQALNLPYRVIELCTGDLGFASSKTYDIEVWFPSQNTYREISSCSNFLDFQARRSMIRYKSDKQTKYVHTLNGSGLPIGRTLAAILENYQAADGSVCLPKVLDPYMSKKELSYV